MSTIQLDTDLNGIDFKEDLKEEWRWDLCRGWPAKRQTTEGKPGKTYNGDWNERLENVHGLCDWLDGRRYVLRIAVRQ